MHLLTVLSAITEQDVYLNWNILFVVDVVKWSLNYDQSPVIYMTTYSLVLRSSCLRKWLAAEFASFADRFCKIMHPPFFVLLFGGCCNFIGEWESLSFWFVFLSFNEIPLTVFFFGWAVTSKSSTHFALLAKLKRTLKKKKTKRVNKQN